MNVSTGVAIDGTCKHCDDTDVETYDGFCRSCKRKGTVLFSKTSDGYQCSLCSIAEKTTTVRTEDRQRHLRDVHGVEPGDTKGIIREYESLMAVETRTDEQQSLTAFAPSP